MPALSATTAFDRNCQRHLQHLKLKGLRPKTIEAYARAIRRAGERFDEDIDHLTEQQLTDHFTALLASHSWSAVKLDLYGLKFYYTHVLRKPWVAPGLIKPPRGQRLPDIVTVEQAQRIFAATRVLSYRVFFFTLYSLGLRLGEGLRLHERVSASTQNQAKSAILFLYREVLGFEMPWLDEVAGAKQPARLPCGSHRSEGRGADRPGSGCGWPGDAALVRHRNAADGSAAIASQGRRIRAPRNLGPRR